MRLRRGGRSWEIREDFVHLFAAEYGRVRPGAQHRQSGHGVGDNAGGTETVTVRTHCKDDSLAFHADVERIARANSEAAAKLAGQNDLALRGDARLHGKTDLTRITGGSASEIDETAREADLIV